MHVRDCDLGPILGACSLFIRCSCINTLQTNVYNVQKHLPLEQTQHFVLDDARPLG